MAKPRSPQPRIESIREFKSASSWQSKGLAFGLRNFVKPVVSRARLTRRFMKFSQLSFDSLTMFLPVHTDVHISPADAGGVPGEWLVAGRNQVMGRVMLYFHGGAYFFGSPRSHRSLTWRLSDVCRSKVLALDYRQPPDWHYPAPIEDALTAYRYLLEQGYRPENISLGGDSAGGNLVLALLQTLREKKLPMPACQVLISPWGDLTASGLTLEENHREDPLIPVNLLRFVAKSYSASHDAYDPLLSPVFAEQSGFPPMILQVGSTEVLLSDAERIAERAEQARVPCRFQVWENQMHVFQALCAWVPEAEMAVCEIGAFVNEAIIAAGGANLASVGRARIVRSGKVAG